MHDPLTVAWEIRFLGLTIWHRDPEIGGDDDSCRWFQDGRAWWKHPRFHVHHWRIKLKAVTNLKRFLWSRCTICGGRFSWGYAPIGYWGSTGPKWFRGEENVFHHECYTEANR